jgi:hypothetical protein
MHESSAAVAQLFTSKIPTGNCLLSVDLEISRVEDVDMLTIY